jgi:hypothetical protein
MRRSIVVLALVLVVVLASACAAPLALAGSSLDIAHAGSVVFTRGRLKTAYRVPLEQAYATAHQALENLMYDVKAERLRGDEAYVGGRGADGRAIAIEFSESSPAVTRMTIRVGFWGDQAVSNVILSEFERLLGTPSATRPAHPPRS